MHALLKASEVVVNLNHFSWQGGLPHMALNYCTQGIMVQVIIISHEQSTARVLKDHMLLLWRAEGKTLVLLPFKWSVGCCTCSGAPVRLEDRKTHQYKRQHKALSTHRHHVDLCRSAHSSGNSLLALSLCRLVFFFSLVIFSSHRGKQLQMRHYSAPRRGVHVKWGWWTLHNIWLSP